MRLRYAPIMLVALLIVSAVTAHAWKVQRVKFARGRTTAVLKGAVVRATNDRYILGAHGGQTMIVHITSI